MSIDAVQGSDDARFHPLSLHHGGEQTGIEDIAVGVIFQLVAEVTVPCRRGRRDDCHPLGEQGHLQLLVQGQHALLLQLCQYLPTPTRHVAQRIGRVDIHDVEGVAVEFVEADGDLHQHLDAGHECLSRLLLEVRLQQPVNRTPYHATRLGYQVVSTGILLYQFQVAVSGRIAADVAQLSLHPIFVRESQFQPTAYQVVQFIE